MSILIDFFSGISPDGWISFCGSLIGAFFTVISILIALHIERKHELQKKRDLQSACHKQLLESLPSIEEICSQADYLDEKDELLGSSSDAESRLKILEDKMSKSACSEEKDNYKRKIERHKHYLKYWNDANKKMNDFMQSGSFNVISLESDPQVMHAYSKFVIAFQNEHNYAGPIITKEILSGLMKELAEKIERAKC